MQRFRNIAVGLQVNPHLGQVVVFKGGRLGLFLAKIHLIPETCVPQRTLIPCSRSGMFGRLLRSLRTNRLLFRFCQHLRSRFRLLNGYRFRLGLHHGSSGNRSGFRLRYRLLLRLGLGFLIHGRRRFLYRSGFFHPKAGNVVDALQVLFIHFQQGDAKSRDLALHLFQLISLPFHLAGVLPGRFCRIIPGVCQNFFRICLCVFQHNGSFILGLLNGVLCHPLGAEDSLFDPVFLFPIGLDFLGKNGQLLLQLCVFCLQVGNLAVEGIHLRSELGVLADSVIPFSLQLGEGFHNFVDEVVYVLRLVSRKASLAKAYFVDFFYGQHVEIPLIDISCISPQDVP